MLDFDQMLELHVGEFGLYQKILFILQAPFCIFVTFVLFGQLFMTNPYPRFYWCEDSFKCTNAHYLITPNLTERLSYLSPEQRTNLTIPVSTVPVPGTPPQYDYRSFYLLNRNQVEDLAQRANSMPAPCQVNLTLDRPRAKRQNSRNRPSLYPLPFPIPNAVRTTTLSSTLSTSESPISPKSTKSTKSPSLISTTTNSPLTPSDNQEKSMMEQMSCSTQQISNIAIPRNTSIPIESVTRANLTSRPCSNCSKYGWNITEFPPPRTIVTGANLKEGWLCAPEMRLVISQAVFFLGAIIGGILIGWIADNYGRIPALMVAVLFGGIGGALTAVSENIYLFSFFRFLTGFAFDNSFTMMYILVLEYIGPNYRTLVANLSIAIFYTIGTIILPWLSLWIGNWRYYALAVSLPMFAGVFAVFLVPESARWLLSKGRAKEATDILRKFAKVNGKHVDEKIFQDFERDSKKLHEELSLDEEEVSLLSALKRPKILKNFILLTIIWSLIALVYDGHSRNVLNLGDNIFLMFTIASSTEFPADVLLIFTLDRLGRRWMAFSSLGLSGVCSILSAAIPAGNTTIALVMAIMSRFFVNVAFNIGLQFAAELLPTVIRAQGVNNIHIMMSYVASIISPFIASLGRTQPSLSLLLLGAFAITAGILSMFLPETLGEDLPNTLEEGEAFGTNQSFWNCPICKKYEPMDDDTPIYHEPTEEQVRRRMRNSMRAPMRGEAFRSSIISKGSWSTKGEQIWLTPYGSGGRGKENRKRYTT